MGNIRNEIGVFYMNQAAALQSERGGKYIYLFLFIYTHTHTEFSTSVLIFGLLVIWKED